MKTTPHPVAARRRFLQGTALGSAAMLSTTLALPTFAQDAGALSKLRLGFIGTGGRGNDNFSAMLGDAGVSVAALCDVDRGCLENAAKRAPDAAQFSDYRRLLAEVKDLDGVVISAPDHHHVYPAVTGLRQGLHVYCEKPLVQSPWEARLITQEAVKRPHLATQMGTGGQAGADFMQTVAVVRSGALGDVKEVHISTDRPIWPQGEPLPEVIDTVPDSLDWDSWIGPRNDIPYIEKYREGRFRDQRVYHPFVWRGRWDFGTGALGDIAPHSMNVAFRALQLGAPTRVEAEATSGMVGNAFPDWSVIRFDFPAIEGRAAVSIYWYDGKRSPPKEKTSGFELGVGGTVFIGTKGIWSGGIRPAPGQSENLYDGWKAPKQEEWPEQPFPEVHADWLAGIREGRNPGCHFGYSGPMTEAYLLGNISLRLGRPLDWDATKFTFNDAEADALLKHEYRDGWGV